MAQSWDQLSLKEIRRRIEVMDEPAQKATCTILLHDTRKGVVTFAEKTLRQQAHLDQERARLKTLWQYEHICYNQGFQAVIGTDEVGRGPLAGPVVAAAVVLRPNEELLGLNDSKKLSEKRREALAEEIKRKAIAWEIAEVSAPEIDRLNILHAAELAMSRAVQALTIGDVVLVDGTNKLDITLPYRNIIGGDSLSASIAAASIIAKVHRDHLMIEMDARYPQFHFAQNKGYGTTDHYEALHTYGPSPIHRRSFRLN